MTDSSHKFCGVAYMLLSAVFCPQPQPMDSCRLCLSTDPDPTGGGGRDFDGLALSAPAACPGLRGGKQTTVRPGGRHAKPKPKAREGTALIGRVSNWVTDAHMRPAGHPRACPAAFWAWCSHVCSGVHAPQEEASCYKQHPAPPPPPRATDTIRGGGGRRAPGGRRNTRCHAQCFALACPAPPVPNPALVPACHAP